MKTIKDISNLEKNYKINDNFEDKSHETIDTSIISNKNRLSPSQYEMVQSQFSEFSVHEKNNSRSTSPSLPPKMLSPRMLTQFKRFSGDPTESIKESLRSDEITNLLKHPVPTTIEPQQPKEPLNENEFIEAIVKLAQKSDSLQEAKTLLTKLYEKQTTLPPSTLSTLLHSSTDPLWLNTLLDHQFGKTKATIEYAKNIIPVFEQFITKTNGRIQPQEYSRLLIKIIKACYPQTTIGTQFQPTILYALAFCFTKIPTQDRKSIKDEIIQTINFYKKGKHELLFNGGLNQIQSSLKNVYKAEIQTVSKMRKDEILQVLFSQDSIDNETMEGMSLMDLVDNMNTKGWKKGTQLTIVKMPDNKLVSLNNRRLFAAKKVCEINEKLEIDVVVANHDDKAPPNLFNGIKFEYTKSRGNLNKTLSTKLVENSYGHCVALRCSTRKGDLNADTFGYTQTEVRK